VFITSTVIQRTMGERQKSMTIQMLRFKGKSTDDRFKELEEERKKRELEEKRKALEEAQNAQGQQARDPAVYGDCVSFVPLQSYTPPQTPLPKLPKKKKIISMPPEKNLQEILDGESSLEKKIKDTFNPFMNDIYSKKYDKKDKEKINEIQKKIENHIDRMYINYGKRYNK
jgi:hypothetical protein